MSETGATETGAAESTPVVSESTIDYNALPDDPHYVPPGSERESDSLASPFLKNIVDDNERKIVEKYVRDWDAGVTKKFQSIHEQYKPYKEAGLSPEEAIIAAQVMRTLDTNPRAVYEILREEFGSAAATEMVKEASTPPVDDPYSDLPPTVAEEFREMKQLVELMAKDKLEQTQLAAQQNEDRMLDKHLSDLHTKYGDFDDDYVMGIVLSGKSWDDAVKQYTDKVNQITGTVRRAPPILGGGGAIPAGKIPPSKLSKEDTQRFIAEQLARTNQD